MYQNLLRHRVGLYEKALPNELSWEDKLATTKELGFDFLEISVDESDERRSRLDWNDEEVYALRRLCEKHGVPLQSMCPGKFAVTSVQNEFQVCLLRASR